MSPFRTSVIITAALACLFSGATVFGANTKFFDKPYDATVTITDSKGSTMENRTLCDGKGHVRTEAKTALGQTITIMDYPKKTAITIMETSKMVMKSPLNPNDATSEPTQKTNIKQLGTQTINGHPCKGESYEVGKTKCEVWTGTDINYPVKSIVNQSAGKVVTELKSYSSSIPPTTSFDAPTAGYKIVGR